MPKNATFPTLFDETLQINVSELKEWNLLEVGRINRSQLKWSINGTKTSRISIVVNCKEDEPYIELDYRCNDEPIRYNVMLVTKKSNLGKGTIWYFRCPETNKLCRKLYLINKRFLHREAFKGCFYESQMQSKKYKEMDKMYGAYLRRDDLYEQLYKKHAKSTYAGKPTKRYLKLMSQIKEVSTR